MKRLLIKGIFVLTGALIATVVYSGNARAYTNSRMIDDQIFDNVNSMSEQQIRNFINSRPNTCLTRVGTNLGGGYVFPEPMSYWDYSGTVDAARVVYKAAQAWGLNPQVILATLQKEQALLTDNDCLDPQGVPTLRKAMGQGCPEGGACPMPAYDGFSQQVMKGAWQLKFNKARANGNTSWDGDDNVVYSGFMTQGNRKRCGTCAINYYTGYANIDGQSIYLENGATAALYTYTPHLNQSFPIIFTTYFGNPTSACLSTGNVAGPAGSKILSYKYGSTAASFLTYTQLNNTGSACAEAHVWKPGFSTWLTNLPTGMRSSNPTLGTYIASKSAVDHKASLNYLIYNGGGNRLEVHRLSPDLRTFPGYYDVSTNLSGVSPTSGMFVAGDFFGRGYDQLVYIIYSGSNGRAEVHMFDPSMRSAIGYYDVATNLSGVSATSGTFVAGDFLRLGRDQLAYILYAGSSGRAEVHVFDPSLRSAIGYYDVPTNLTAVSNATGTFVGGDFIGRGYSQLVYIIYNNGVGRVETHMFNQSMTQATGFQDVITNLTGFDPSQ